MKKIQLALALLLTAIGLPPAARAAEKAGTSANIRAILITATNLKREADPKLAKFEAELQRNIPLSSFRYVAEGSATISSKQPAATIPLKGGHRLQIEGEKSGDGIRVKALWTNGKEVMYNISLTLQPGVPAVLGRRPSGDGDASIILLIPN